MSTGYLVATGQDPYIARDLSSIFQDASFRGITSLGYPPPWALVLGLIYLATYKIIPNLLLYNLAIKLPIITANLCLAYLVTKILKKLGVDERTARNAWLFMLFNPLLLLTTSAWGQIDSIVALFALLALLLLSEGKPAGSALLLALAVAFKPTTLPLIPAVFVFLPVKPYRSMLLYFAVFCTTLLVLSAGPFLLFRWQPGNP